MLGDGAVPPNQFFGSSSQLDFQTLARGEALAAPTPPSKRRTTESSLTWSFPALRSVRQCSLVREVEEEKLLRRFKSQIREQSRVDDGGKEKELRRNYFFRRC